MDKTSPTPPIGRVRFTATAELIADRLQIPPGFQIERIAPGRSPRTFELEISGPELPPIQADGSIAECSPIIHLVGPLPAPAPIRWDWNIDR